MSKKPNEDQIENLLQSIKPEPGNDFHERLKNAPWQKKEPKLIQFPYKKAAAIVLLSLAFLVFFQPARVIAELIASFFQVRAGEGTITMVMPEPTAVIIPSPSLVPDMLALQDSLSFTIHQPTYLPEGYVVEQVVAQAGIQGAELYYTLAGENTLGRSLALFQSPEGYDFEIGDNAIVQLVEIGAIQAEYVQGNWETISSSEMNGNISIHYAWDNTVQMHSLAWERDGIFYRLLWQAAGIPYPEYYGDGAPDEAGYLSLQDLIRIAASID